MWCASTVEVKNKLKMMANWNRGCSYAVEHSEATGVPWRTKVLENVVRKLKGTFVLIEL